MGASRVVLCLDALIMHLCIVVSMHACIVLVKIFREAGCGAVGFGFVEGWSLSYVFAQAISCFTPRGVHWSETVLPSLNSIST